MANEQSNQLNLTVVALVALVAIVGLVALVMSASSAKQLATGSRVVSASEQTAETNTAGKAVKAPENKDGAPPDCYQGGNGMICPGLNDQPIGMGGGSSGGGRSAGALCNGASGVNQCRTGYSCVGYPVGTCQPNGVGSTGGSGGATPPSTSCKPLGERCTAGRQCCSNACNRNTCT